jgi:heavy metal sensor kinase
MSSRRRPKPRASLALRLTLWYAGIFTLTAAIAFLCFYLLITSVIRERIDQDLLAQKGTFVTAWSLQGSEAVRRMAIGEAQAAGEKKIFIRLLSINGDVFSSSNMAYWQNIEIRRQAVQRLIQGAKEVLETVRLPDSNAPIRVLYAPIAPGIILQLGHSMENYNRVTELFRRIFILTMSILIVLAALIGWIMARTALSGLATITQTAQQITDGDFSKRVARNERGDELDLLADTFNRMLDRIELLVRSIKEMSDNIAHDLRSPVARIRGVAEVALTTETSPMHYERSLGSIVEECDRLLDMINTMLTISETEAGVDRIADEPIDLVAVLQDACELFKPTAEDHGVHLTAQLPAEHCPAIGDNRLIQRMFANLIDNAIKYTPSGGKVLVTLTDQPDNGFWQITIKDSGIGIPEKDLPHIFERFYRCDPSRSLAGVGLGLSLAKAVALAHGGDIHVVSQPAEGSRLTVSIPAPQYPAQ